MHRFFLTEEEEVATLVAHVRRFAVVDAVRVDDDVAVFALPEDQFQPRDVGDIKKLAGMGIGVVFEDKKKPAEDAEAVMLDA